MTANDVYTVAGSSAGTSGSSGDGGAAASALFNVIGGVTIDGVGDLYLADSNNNEVREMTANAAPTTAMAPNDVYSLAGTGATGTSGDNAQATEAEFDDPISSAIDSSGNIYVADENNSRVQEIAATTHSQWGISMTAGDVYTIAGSAAGSYGTSGDGGAATSALLDGPSGVAVDAAGDLYIADQGNNRIQEIAAATGTQWGVSMTATDIYTIAGSSSGTSGHSGNAGAAISALLDQPRNIAFDAAGNLYIDDTYNNRVQLVAKATCSSACPFGLASTTANDIYTVAGSSTGTSGSSGDGGAATSALFNMPKGLTFDAAGNLYVADCNNNRIQEVAVATGTQWGISMTANDIYTLAGSSSGTSGHSGDGAVSTSALLSGVRDVTFDAAGDLYIADGANNRIQEVSASTSTQWGTSMTVDDIYTIAGSSSGSSGWSGDGGAATSALFDLPGGIATDSAGDLYITDESNNEVREVIPAILAPTLPYETSGGGNPAEYDSHPQTPASTSQKERLLVDAVTGTVSNSVTDLSESGSGIPLSLTRTYDSARAALLGPFGYGWTDSYNMSIAAGSGSLSNTEQVTQENGSVAYFYQNKQGTWTAPQREHATLSYNSANSTWTFTRNKTDIFTFNASGELTQESNPNGYVTTLAYNAASELATVTANEEVGVTPGASQSLVFSYGANGLISQVTDSQGRAVTYSYDGGSELSAVSQVGPIQRVVGDVYSIAGTGVAGTSGDNAQATEAELDAPFTTAVDASGDIYEADEFNSRIQEIAGTTHSQWGISMTAGDIYTVAGSSSGSAGHTGDGGAATSALLSNPSGVAVDATGNLYIADQGNNRIQEVAAATGAQWGISMTANDIYTIAGSSTGSSGHSGNAGAATSALLNQPRNTAFDAAGNLYIADQGNNRIQVVAKTSCSSACPFGLASTTANDIYTVAGSSTGTSGSSGDGGAATSALFNTVKGLGFDAAGNLYIADYSNNRIQEVAVSTGTQWGISMTADDVYTVAGSSSGSSGSSGDGGAATSALLNQPRGVAVDPAGDFYIADGTNNRLQEVVVSTGTQWGVSMTADDVYTVAGSSAGTSGSSGDGGAAASALFNGIGGVTIDSVGNLYIADSNNNEVREVPANAAPTAPMAPNDVYSVAGTGAAGTSGDNAQATEAEFSDPVSSAVDASGNVYVADETNSRVQEIAGTTHSQWGISMTAGDVYTIAGSAAGSFGTSGDGGAATSALLDGPSGVAVDAAGDLYIADQENNRIQEIAAATGTQWGISMTANDIYTIAGSSSGTSGHSGDAGAATSALLNLPRNVAFDGLGNLYISDMSNNRIQLVAKTSCSSACPFGLASTTANDIYTVAGSSSGTSGSSGDGGAATSALLNTVKGLAFDAVGNLYVADSANNRVQEVAAGTGTQWGISMTANDVYTVAGSSSGTSGHSGDGGASTSALLSAPRDVTFDVAGDLYIADGANNRIQEVSASTSAQWGTSMTVDDIYTIAGSSSGSSGSSGDGGAASSALFNVPAGVTTDAAGDLFVADSSNNEVREIRAAVQYGYATVGTASHILDGVTDSLSEAMSLAYASSGCPASAADCISSVTDPKGSTTTWSYSLNGSGTGTVLVTDPFGDETQYGVTQYDLTTETDGYGSSAPSTTETSPDPATGEVFIVRQPTGGLTISYYDLNGDKTASIDQRGELTTTQFNSLDEPLVETAPTGEVTTDTYNGDGDLTSSAQPIPSGGTATTNYYYTDSAHPDKPSSVTDPNSHTTSYTYAASGLQASVTDPAGDETTYTYNSLGEKATMVSPRGNVIGGTPANFTSSFVYDSFGNLVETIDPLGHSTLEAYNALGQKLSSTDANGNTTTYAYNTDGELASETQANGTTLSYTYDSNGNKASSTDGNGKTTTYVYDARGDMLSQTDPLSHTTSFTYDVNGNKTSMTDSDGNVTTYTYNSANELTTQTNGYGTAAATTVSYTYDGDGNKASYSDGSGRATTYAYNALNQLTSTTDPLGKTTSYTYDSAGNQATETNPDSQTTTWTYNGDNKVTGISYSDGVTHSVSYTYDADNNVATMGDGSGTSTYTYDDADRLTSYENGAGVTVTYGNDAAGNDTSITYASGKTVTQSFDSLNRLASVTDWNSNASTYAYDADGNQLSLTYPNGVVDTGVYNNASQLTSITDKLGASTLVSFSYTPDNAGLTTSETDTGTPGAGTNSNTYNSLQEVTAAGAHSYTYDQSTDLTTSPSGNTQGFNADSEVCFSGSGSGTCGSPPAGATTYSYSNEGNRTATTPSSGTTYAFGWTEANQMKSATPSVGNATSYVYDGNSLLQSETTASTTTDFTWNVQPSLPLMLSDGTNYYIYGTGTDPIEQIAVSGGATSYLLSDQLGSTRAITNSSGTVTGSVTYDGWGNETGTSGSITTPFLYAGEYLDSPSGFYYLRARWYDPATGEFVSLDPQVNNTQAPYGYAGNDPVNSTDSSGLDRTFSYGCPAYAGSEIYVEEDFTTNKWRARYQWNAASNITGHLELFELAGPYYYLVWNSPGTTLHGFATVYFSPWEFSYGYARAYGAHWWVRNGGGYALEGQSIAVWGGYYGNPCPTNL